MASKAYEREYGHLRDVVVHHPRAGCELCGSRERHTHTQPDWQEHLDRTGSHLPLGLRGR